MTDLQIAWLTSQNININNDVVDCDPDLCTVTFANGKTRRRVENWTRVMGYHRPVSSFNIGKKGEHNERVLFVED